MIPPWPPCRHILRTNDVASSYRLANTNDLISWVGASLNHCIHDPWLSWNPVCSLFAVSRDSHFQNKKGGWSVMKRWRCTSCGYIYEGESPPDPCPICKKYKAMKPGALFVEIKK
jgi:rubredoxin